eukprot:TRINITY_DN602_c0_g1_i4.p1 TRINITY_DN602_c0_g1~~TRINITY_DN602_c0_g1_i4.p1  ORF type:complete len:511 (+),score=68.03 TRINITY_DN602_c0_g1_i4:56-1588(+)
MVQTWFVVVLLFTVLPLCNANVLFSWDDVRSVTSNRTGQSCVGLRGDETFSVPPRGTFIPNTFRVWSLGVNSSSSVNPNSYLDFQNLVTGNNAVQAVCWINVTRVLLGANVDLFLLDTNFTALNSTLSLNGTRLNSPSGSSWGGVEGCSYDSATNTALVSHDTYYISRVDISTGNSIVVVNGSGGNNNWKQVRFSNKGGLWATDSQNQLVSYFESLNPGQTTPEFSFGQNYSSPEFKLNIPIGLALDQTQTVMWVSDENRILRYRSPFNGSLPEAVFGADSFVRPNTQPTTPTTDNNCAFVTSLEFDDNSKQLFISDLGFKRTLIGVTDLGTPGTIVYGDQNVSSGNFSLPPNTNTLIITGNIVFTNNTQTSLNQGQSIIIGRCASFGGNLSLNLNSSAVGQNLTNLISYDCYNDSSTFGSIQIQTDGKAQSCVQGSPTYGEKSFGVLIGNSGQCGGGDGNDNQKRNIIIGVVVGVVGCIIISLIIAAILLVVIHIIKNKKLEASGSARV